MQWLYTVSNDADNNDIRNDDDVDNHIYQSEKTYMHIKTRFWTLQHTYFMDNQHKHMFQTMSWKISFM